jgi:dipeptidyl aminopeptidase/acylaminoacyl peptidase
VKKQISPYGSWASPITSERVSTGATRLGQIEIDGDDIYWIEMRPTEGGRNVIIQVTSDQKMHDVIFPPWNARTRVHEYGGGAYKVNHEIIYFTHFPDQRIYTIACDAPAKPITPPTSHRYADFTFDNHQRRLICVQEDHSRPGQETINALISMEINGNDAKTIVAGNDFYSSPRISPNGRYLAWITWNHPSMPWDHTALWVGTLGADHKIDNIVQVTDSLEEAVVQPRWSPDNILYFISDRSSWWNIYRWTGEEVTPVCPMDAEYATPPWIFAQSNYTFESEHTLVCSYATKDRWHLATIDTDTGCCDEKNTPYTHISNLQVSNHTAVFIGGSPSEVSTIVTLDLNTEITRVLRRSSEFAVDPKYLSVPIPIEFPTERQVTAHAFYYAPCNPEFRAPAETKPPLLVFVHGGPTAAASTTLSWTTQFWTSRGFAVVDVNYGGSSGFGREYRQRLNGYWGVVDMDDCVNAATYLVATGVVDGEYLAIRGGSAGGYTTINALTFRDVFKAGASYYGISDLEVFLHDTHKFESRYLDTLIGPYPERQERYHDRSAIHFLDQLRTPMILFQGLDDPIVPPSQAEIIVDALKRNGKPVAYLPFAGEQHGFRKAANIQRSLDAELYFYAQIFGFTPDKAIDPIEITNL